MRTSFSAWLAAASSCALLSLPAHAAPLVVEVHVDAFDAMHQAEEDAPGEWIVSDQYPCSFVPFDFDPAIHDSVSFVFEQAARVTLPDVYMGASVYAISSGACTGSFNYSSNQRTGTDAIVDDTLVGNDTPAFDTSPTVLDGETDSPVGFSGHTLSVPGDAPWNLAQLTIGVPKYGLGAATYSPCGCAMWFGFGDLQPADRRGFVAPLAPASLIDVQEAGPAQCDDGGILVHVGLDDGLPDGTVGDGVLQPGERDTTHPVCDGAQGDDGADGDDGRDSLIALSDVADGDDACPAGGTRIDVGLDDGEGDGSPGDGELDEDEVDATRVICGAAGESSGDGGVGEGPGGSDGHNAAARAIQIPEGDALCPHGGVRVATGIDQDDDGELDDSEATSSQVLCEPSTARGSSEGCSVGTPGRPFGEHGVLSALCVLALALAFRRRSTTSWSVDRSR